MDRIVAIDYGTKRMGVAVTDPLRLIATPLATVEAPKLMAFLQQYMAQEAVDTVVVGMPKHLNNTASAMTVAVEKFIRQLQQAFPGKSVLAYDERYTSKIAQASMIEAGFKKKDRRNKAHLDRLSATILLQSFLNHTKNIVS